MNHKIMKTTIFLGILDTITIIMLITIYGNFSSFQDWWITTSIATGSHKYFANIFYSDNTIKNVLQNNSITEMAEEVDLNDITFDTNTTQNYESIYDEQILDHDPDALYKLIRIDEKNYNGYLVAIYDPSRISLATSEYGKKLTQISKDNDAIVAINASGFSISNSKANGIVIKDGKVNSIGGVNRHGGGLIGFTHNNVLMLTTDDSYTAISKGLKDAVEFGPFLIINGKSSKVKGNGGMGVANRTAIAQRKDGIVLFLVIDGRGANDSQGISIEDMIKLLERYKAYNAANLDGGGSSTLVINQKLVNKPKGFYGDEYERYLPNAWIVK